MARVNTVERVRALVNRLQSVPSLLIKTELDAILGMLESDIIVKTRLDSVLQRERRNIGEYALSFAQGKPYNHAVDMEFANTPERRAAFGYQILLNMFKNGGVSSDQVKGAVLALGEKYKPSGTQNASWKENDKITSFVNIFVSPIVDYLEISQNVDDFMLTMMLRYKQRSEWFDTDYLVKRAMLEDGKGQIEGRLKEHFYRYLFDQGLDFTIEPSSPADKSEADVLTAKLSDGRRLIVEAKVYDGKGKNEAWVKDGIAQSARYALQWGEPRAYLLVYNIFENSVMKFIGASQENNLWLINSLGKEIRIVDVNLNKTLPASEAGRFKEVKIDCI